LPDEWDVPDNAVSNTTDEAAAHQHLKDDLLRLLFTCCHPSLTEESQITLMLRIVLDLSVAEIAAAFLSTREAVERRITRAKATLAAAGDGFVVPSEDQLLPRQTAVLRVVYLLFNHAYSRQGNVEVYREKLLEQAIRLGRELVNLFSASGETRALLALMLLTAARTDARYGATGEFVPLTEQDRKRWNWPRIREGRAVIDAVVSAGHAPSAYQIQAAIAALHDVPDASSTDWAQIAGLYALLERHDPSPAVPVNRAVAMAFAGQDEAAMALLDVLAEDRRLANYQPLYAARAHVLVELGRPAAALPEYDRAISLVDSAPERGWLEARRASVAARQYDSGQTRG
jgi:predicted RNA polymerase sigma factor